jgi:prevent-host-death family protein
MKTMTTLDLRKKLGSILDEVSKKKEQVIISRANKPIAVLISLSEYEDKILKKDRERKLKEILCKMDEWRKKHEESTRVDVVKIIREMRDSR